MKVTTLEKLQEVVSELKERILTKASTTDYTATLTTTWSGTAALFTQNVAISGITSNDKPIIDLVPSDTAWETQETEWTKIVKAESYDGGIKFYAKEKTSAYLPIAIKVVE